MHRIIRAGEECPVNSFCMDLWPQASMHKPLLIPDDFQSSSRDFTQERRDVWATKRAESDLAWIVVIGVAIVERRPRSGKNQEGLEVRLEQHVDMYPLTDIATIAHVARQWIESIGRLRNASLD